MGKSKEKKDNLNRSLVMSVVLHIILIGLIVIGSLVSVVKLGGGGEEGTVIDAVMVDLAWLLSNMNKCKNNKTWSDKQLKSVKSKNKNKRLS
nr:hypothetical protein [Providencia sp. G1(2023)]